MITGLVNPSRRFSITFPVSDEQIPVNTKEQYSGINLVETYSEELLVGYRWYDAKQQEPLFPFGHGLSYTTFEYSKLHIASNKQTLSSSIASVHVEIENTGML